MTGIAPVEQPAKAPKVKPAAAKVAAKAEPERSYAHLEGCTFPAGTFGKADEKAPPKKASTEEITAGWEAAAKRAGFRR